MTLNKTHELSYTDGIDVSTIGTGDPLNALEIVQDFILDYHANTDGISDELVMAYNCFQQDLADELSMTAFLEEKAREVAEGTECRNWDSSEECRDASCLHHEILDILEEQCPDCTGGDSIDGSTEGTMPIECGACMSN